MTAEPTSASARNDALPDPAWLADPAPPADPVLAEVDELRAFLAAEADAAGGHAWSTSTPDERARLVDDALAGNLHTIRRMRELGYSPADLLADATALVAPGPAGRTNGRAPDAVATSPAALSTMTRPATVDEWLVEGALRPSTFMVLGAMEGTGKSYLRDELAMRCALGKGSLLGFYPVVRKVNVLLVDEDNGPEEEWRRNEAMLAHLGAERSQLTGYYRISLAGVLLDDPAWQARIRQWVAELEVGLLILDPVSMMYRAKELREELLPVANFLRALQREHPGLVVVLVHHLRKPVANQKPTDRALSDLRGALWGQVADVVALVTPLGDRRVKWSLHKRIRPSELILEQTQAGPFAFVAEADAADRRQSSDDRVMACVDAGAMTIGEVVLGTGMPERTAWAAVKRLRAAGILRPDGSLERAEEAPE